MSASEHIEGIKQTGGTITATSLAAGRNATINIASEVADSSAPDEIKVLIKTLADQIEAVKPKVEAEKATQMAGDFETLGKEVVKEQPRQKWYELTLSGLKEAAEAIGDIGKPITETVASLMKLLLP